VPTRLSLSVFAACLLCACGMPAPETLAPTPAPTEAATATPSPVPATETPPPTPEPTRTPIPRRVVVVARGNVICGFDAVRPDLLGFETDVCRSVAAALFDNPDAAEVRTLDLSGAPDALASGEIDLFIGPVDLDGVAMGPTLFIDTVGAIARNDVGIRTLVDLKFATVCVMQDSAAERLFEEAAAAQRVPFQPLWFSDLETMYARYEQGHCDAIVDDRIRLAGRLPALSAPRDQGWIDLALAAGARALLTGTSDANWSDVVNAVGGSLIRAEALRIDSANLDAALAGEEEEIRAFLGVDGEAGSGPGLGLSGDFAARIIRHVGSLAEIYERHFPTLPRGPNALAQDGGAIGAP